MKFSISDFLANPWKYLAIGFVLCLLAAFAKEPNVGNWTLRLIAAQFGLPALAGLVGYILLKRRHDRGGSDT